MILLPHAGLAGKSQLGGSEPALDDHPGPAAFWQSRNHEFTFVCDLSVGLGYAGQ
jgi:hypothetical protein